MKRFTKLVVTITALAALAVGGAAFAQAQNASTPVTVPTHQSIGEQMSPGDTAGDQSGPDQAGETDGQDSASEQNDAPDSASEKDGPDGSNAPVDSPDQGSQED